MLDRIDDSTVRLTYRLPFREGPPPVNLYLLEGDRPVLVDTGPNDDRVLAELEADLAAVGHRIEGLAEVVVTHHHVDHSGLAGRIAERSGAPIRLHREDVGRGGDDPARRPYALAEVAAAVVFWGLPEQVRRAVPRSYEAFFRYSAELPESAWSDLEEGPIVLAGRRLEVLHCPGHSAGLCVLWEPERGLLFANDHLLPDISSNPAYYAPPFRGRRCGLGDFMASLEKVRDLPARLVLPGHGKPFSDVAGRVAEIRAEFDERRDVILARLAGGRATVVDLVGAVWDRAALSPTHVYLACREVHGHLEILAGEGLVDQETIEGVGWFSALATRESAR